MTCSDIKSRSTVNPGITRDESAERQAALLDLLTALTPVNTCWQNHALCRGMDGELFFFPETGESPTAARAVCSRCPVSTECLAAALERNEKFGIWARTTPRQRRTLRRDIFGAIRARSSTVEQAS